MLYSDTTTRRLCGRFRHHTNRHRAGEASGYSDSFEAKDDAKESKDIRDCVLINIVFQ